MSKGIFITGTDTGVGKTIVSAAIIRALIKKGVNPVRNFISNGVKVGAMKPMETGCVKAKGKGQEKILIPSDGMFLKDMAEMDDSMDLIAPVRFEHPLAPMVASDLEFGVQGLKKIFNAYETLSKKYDFMVVEGVGGLLVPISKRQRAKGKGQRAYFVSDLIKDLKLPVIIVARATLGTINHTLLTVNHALREGLNVLGVIINCHTPPTGDIAEKTNPDVLRKICPVSIIGTLPYIGDITRDNIEDAALKHLEVIGLF